MSTKLPRICHQCDDRLEQASRAMRSHASVMRTALDLVRRGGWTEEQRQDFTTRLVTSFNNAQSAWDLYREHLMEHGILPKAS